MPTPQHQPATKGSDHHAPTEPPTVREGTPAQTTPSEDPVDSHSQKANSSLHLGLPGPSPGPPHLQSEGRHGGLIASQVTGTIRVTTSTASSLRISASSKTASNRNSSPSPKVASLLQKSEITGDGALKPIPISRLKATSPKAAPTPSSAPTCSCCSTPATICTGVSSYASEHAIADFVLPDLDRADSVAIYTYSRNLQGAAASTLTKELAYRCHLRPAQSRSRRCLGAL